MTAPALAHRFSSAAQALSALQAPIASPVPEQPRVLLQSDSEALTVKISALATVKIMARLESTLLAILVGGIVLVLLPLGIQTLVDSLRSVDFAGIGAGLLLSTLGGVACLLVLTALKRFFGITQLTFTAETVTACFSLWGIPYRRKHCRLSPVTDLEVLPFGSTDTAVALKTLVRSSPDGENFELLSDCNVVIAEKLSQEEGKWLVQEVKNWLRENSALT